MTLPKAKNKNLINEKEFVKNAKKVKESFEEKIKYLQKKKVENADNILSHLNSFS